MIEILHCFRMPPFLLKHYMGFWNSCQEVANIAQWEDEQIEYIKERVTEEGRREDIKKGKAPAQVL